MSSEQFSRFKVGFDYMVMAGYNCARKVRLIMEFLSENDYRTGWRRLLMLLKYSVWKWWYELGRICFRCKVGFEYIVICFWFFPENEMIEFVLDVKLVSNISSSPLFKRTPEFSLIFCINCSLGWFRSNHGPSPRFLMILNYCSHWRTR